MRKGILLVIAALSLVSVAGLTLAFSQDSSPDIQSTEDIGAIFPNLDIQIEPAEFAPTIPRADVVSRTEAMLSGLLEDPSQHNLTAKATVARYTGLHDKTKEPLTGREVWVVVIDDLPIHLSAGPRREDGKVPVYRNQLVVTYDAHTGEVINEAVRGQRIGFTSN